LCFGAVIPPGDVLPLLVAAEHRGSRDDRLGGRRTRSGFAGLLRPRDRAGSSASGSNLAALPPAFST